MLQQFSAARLLDLDAQNVCIIKPSALGDVVQTIPLLGALRRRFPAAKLSWVANRELVPLLDGHPLLHEVLPFDRRGSWSDSFRLLRALRARRFDLVFDLQGLLRTGIMTAATGAAVRVGLETAREGAHLAVNCRLPDSGRQVPAHARYWRVAEALGVGDAPRETQIPITEADVLCAREELRSARRPVLALHPGAKWISKRWPVENFAEIAGRAADLFGCTLVLLGSRDERSLTNAIADLLAARGIRAHNLAGTTSLRQLAAILQAVDLVISNDSGPMHLAAGLGTPVVGLFTCTSPRLSGPPGSQHELVATTLPCAASYRKVCPHPGAQHLACLHELSVERVWQSVLRAFQRGNLTARSA